MANAWLKWVCMILLLVFIGIMVAGQKHWKNNIQEQAVFLSPAGVGQQAQPPQPTATAKPSKPSKLIAAADPAWLFTNGKWTSAQIQGWGEVRQAIMYGRRAHIMTNSPAAILKQRGIGGTVSVFVDSQLAVSQSLPNDGAVVEIPLFSGVPGWHTIEIAFSHTSEIDGLYVEHGSELKQPASKYKKKLVVIGHSYAEGGNASDMGLKSFTALLGEQLGVEAINQGVAGTDVNVNSDKDKLNSGFNRLKKDVIDEAPDYVLVTYGLNVIPSDTKKVQADFTSFLSSIRKELPATTIFVSGILSIPSLSDKQLQPYNSSIQNAVKAVNNVVFIDMAGQWNEGNYAKYLSDDKVLPNDEGHQYLADKYAAIIRPYLK